VTHNRLCVSRIQIQYTTCLQDTAAAIPLNSEWEDS